MNLKKKLLYLGLDFGSLFRVDSGGSDDLGCRSESESPFFSPGAFSKQEQEQEQERSSSRRALSFAIVRSTSFPFLFTFTYIHTYLHNKKHMT